MKLDRIEIHNFRSIKDATINFDHHCRILLGKNEAGKSNVLKAIAAIFGDYKISSKDKRKKIDNEKIDLYYVRAIAVLSEEEIDKIVDLFEQDNKIYFDLGRGIKDFVRTAFKEFLINIDIKDEAKPSYTYWKFMDDTFKTSTGEGLSINDALEKLFEIVVSVYEEKPFVCHYWEYNDGYLLPSSVNIAEFVAKPTICRGLKNLFVLCDRGNIKKEFDDATAQDGDFHNLLKQVSKKVTNTFRSIWPDFKDTSIELLQNGSTISIKVSNKAYYTFADRSDGFKHFVSILLMLSAPSKKDQIGERDIILIDEPDRSLYPATAKNLRDELLRMGEKTYVVYATHSQYMIDSDCISRHIIVEKKDDVTTLIEPNEKAEYSEDSLLLNAIGTSIFDCIRGKNIIFEGWLDKRLFDKYITWNKSYKTSFKDYGRVYLHGINGVMTLIQLLILAEKKFVIVADSDQASTGKKKEFIEAYSDYKKDWIGYSDVVPGVLTVEDFLKPDYIEKYIKSNYEKKFTFDLTKSTIQNIESVTKDKKTIKLIKNDLITESGKDDVRDEYGLYLKAIIKHYLE